MLSWWYRHVPGTMQYADGTYSRYLVWHPLDHISYEIENEHPVGEATIVEPGTPDFTSWRHSDAILRPCSTSTLLSRASTRVPQ